MAATQTISDGGTASKRCIPEEKASMRQFMLEHTLAPPSWPSLSVGGTPRVPAPMPNGHVHHKKLALAVLWRSATRASTAAEQIRA